MSDIRTIVAKLRAAGMDADSILSVVEDIDAMLAGAQAVEPLRTKRQDRNARYYEGRKERLKASDERLNKTSEQDATPSPPNGPLSLPQTPTLTPLNPPTPSTPRRERGCALPADWRPSAKHFALGYDRRFVEQQADAMREWAGANRNRAVARKADWDLTFAGWLRREAGKSQNRGPPRPAKPSYSDLARSYAEEALNGQQPANHPSHEPAAGRGFGRGAGDHPSLFERGRVEHEPAGPIVDVEFSRSEH